jgi:hypothetical protein
MDRRSGGAPKSLRYVIGKDKLWGAHFWRRIKRQQ